MKPPLLLLSAFCVIAFSSRGAAPPPARAVDKMIGAYFQHETERIQERSLREIQGLDDWQKHKQQYRRELEEMLGLSPFPERTGLQATVTGTIDHELFRVEKVHFQSMPGLYVTGNLYLPKTVTNRVPAILYVCGHALVKTNGISYGNKVGYQHHGAWFARNGYACLLIDTIQLGEIEGIHHGTYRENMWWWNSRGYTPAGVEAWNSIRALDFLASRPEVDPDRLGVTGRSGGGAYSWWLAALDDRVKAAAPVAGITDLENHVVDGVVEGHCDCMFIVNTYRWDYAQVAALMAPRPLLICNSDKDSIFPLDGVLRVHQAVRQIYQLHNATDKLGLLITEGPHKDTQDLQVPVFRWFNRWLKKDDAVIEMAATRFFTPEQLKVFPALPADERTSKIHETFVPIAATPPPPASADDWAKTRAAWLEALEGKVFRSWSEMETPLPLNVELAWSDQAAGLRLEIYYFKSEPELRLPLFVVRKITGAKPTAAHLTVMDEKTWADWARSFRPPFQKNLPPELKNTSEATTDDPSRFEALARTIAPGDVLAYLAPRGIGPTAWSGDAKKQSQIRRRFLLLGTTLDAARVWDVRRAVHAIQAISSFANVPIYGKSSSSAAVNLLYAAIYEPAIRRIDLLNPPASHRSGPDYLNVLRFLDVPQATALAAEKTEVHIFTENAEPWHYSHAVAERLGWPKTQLTIEAPSATR